MDFLKPDPELYDVPTSTEDFHGMPYRQLGESGLRVSAIGLGTWKFGYPDTGDGARVDEATAMEIFDRSIELGVTFWDTANRYNLASGNSERVIGKWFKANPDQRRNVVLATKMYGGMDGTTPNHSGLSRGNIRDSVHASLKRLQLDYVDMLYFHRFDPSIPIQESLETIDDLVRAGDIRYFAASNFSVDNLVAYRDIQRQISDRCRIVAVQNQFDPLQGETKNHSGVLEYCADNRVSYVPFSPLARGLLTNRYLDAAKVGPGDRLFDEGNLDSLVNEQNLRAVAKLGTLASEYGVDISQLALAYTLSMPGMGAMIPSSSSVAQLESNAKAGTVRLTDEQIAAVRSSL